MEVVGYVSLQVPEKLVLEFRCKKHRLKLVYELWD